MTIHTLRHIVFLPLPTTVFGGNLGVIRHDIVHPKPDNHFQVNRFQFKVNRVWFAGAGDVIDGVQRKFWVVNPEIAEPLLKTLSYKEDFDLLANQLPRLRGNPDLRELMQEAGEHAHREHRALERMVA